MLVCHNICTEEWSRNFPEYFVCVCLQYVFFCWTFIVETLAEKIQRKTSFFVFSHFIKNVLPQKRTFFIAFSQASCPPNYVQQKVCVSLICSCGLLVKIKTGTKKTSRSTQIIQNLFPVPNP